ncbi:class I SAM-dependent methyltransferase [Propionispora vibrioides]|uniref:Methyltransferase domain-containing protein n=1 Tax=Propionispora vibrioides TaxID=112903 RepID=A0A1H8VTD7_9FIRM|nr:class I SAM-dependent methyltransferase [Propionispora vibrioides]SEP18487.1 Methyltransferase domain-containing protein [Propionispora vibrioides]
MDNNNIKKAYACSKNIYDDMLTRKKWWSKLYIWFFWSNVNDIEMANRVLTMIPSDFSGKMLDVPVGTGVFTLDKYRVLPNAEITCVDYSEDMLLQARERFSASKLSNVTCIQGDVGDLNFGDETFDIVLSMNGFHAFPDKEKAFFETARVLKKDGIFCGCFYIKGQCKRTDFIVNFLLAKKGWFTPPFQSLEELRIKLLTMYSQVEIDNEKSMVYFKCVK